MTNFDWLGNHPDTALYGALAEACEQLASAAPERFDLAGARRRLTDPLETQEK